MKVTLPPLFRINAKENGSLIEATPSWSVEATVDRGRTAAPGDSGVLSNWTGHRGGVRCAWRRAADDAIICRNALGECHLGDAGGQPLHD
jgi:hypothetical protein